MKLVVTIGATANYCYAMKTLARRVAANVAAAELKDPGTVIIAGDNSKEVKAAVKVWGEIMPKNWTVIHLPAGQEGAGDVNYKEPAQLLIARLRSAAFSEARRINPDYCWSLDSDTLPPPNALRCMLDMLRFDRGYYSISTCPYPNEAFMGGRGTPQNPIGEDWLQHERRISPEVQAEIDAVKKLEDENRLEVEALKKEAEGTEPGKVTEPTPEWTERKKKSDDALGAWLIRKEACDKKIRECPPDGNVFQVNGKHGWRARGWLDHCYPAMGKGVVVPIDWSGFGCALMNDEALGLANFEGYDGKGTEDLFIVWRRWWPAGLRLNCIMHCPCDHVIWHKKKGGNAEEFTLIESYHETQGECVGHLRTRKTPWKEN